MKIIKVVDTRAYEEGPDDKWYPIPGSGEVNICSRCNKGHEIHVTVEDLAGRYAIVGLGCAKKENLISETQHKGITSAAISLAKNKAKLEKLLKLKDHQEKIIAEVEKLPLPEIEKESKENQPNRWDNCEWWKMGSSRVRVEKWMDLNERKRHLVFSWREDRKTEMNNGKSFSLYYTNSEIENVKKSIKKLEKKIQKLMEG